MGYGPPMGYGPQDPPPGPPRPPRRDPPVVEPEAQPEVPLKVPKPEPRGYGTHVPQTPYMASTSEPTPVKRAPLSFNLTGVTSIPSRPTRAQAHSEMGVQTLADFHHPVKKETHTGGYQTDQAVASTSDAIIQARPRERTRGTQASMPVDRKGKAPMPIPNEAEAPIIHRPRAPLHYHEDRVADINRQLRQANVRPVPAPAPLPPPPPQRAFLASQFPLLNAGMAQADGGYQPPQVPNAWQGFQEPIVVQLPRDPLLQKLLLPYGEADEPPPFQASADPSKPAAPKKKKKIQPRIQGPPQAVDHHRDAVPQLHEKLLNHGKHGRQQRNENYSAENPRPMPVSPRRYPIWSSNPESKRIASDSPGAPKEPRRRDPVTRKTYQPKGDSGKGKRSGYAAGHGPMYDLD